MMSSLKGFETAAQAPGDFLFHPKPNGNVGFLDAIAILADRGEGNSNDSVFVANFGNEVHMQRRCSVVKDDDPRSVRLLLSDRSNHTNSFSRDEE